MNIKQLLQYIEGNSTQEEKEAIARWLDKDENNWTEFMNLRKSYDLTLANLKDNIPYPQHIKEKRKRNIVSEILKIAAVFIISFGCYYLFDLTGKHQEEDIVMHTFHVPAGQRAELTLADGTNVWLNAKTTLTFPGRFDKANRKVKLDGEAYFTVKDDPANPFIINTSEFEIKVLGTEFNLSAYNTSNSFETSLIKGSLEVTSLKTNETIKLSPDSRVYRENGKLIKTSIEHYNHFLWKDGLLSFENERFETIINKLQLYYDVKIILNKSEISDLLYTGKFWTKDGVDQVMKVLQIRAEFNYTKDNEKNLITIY